MQMTLKEWLAQNSYASAEEALAEWSELDDDDVYPALCTEDSENRPHFCWGGFQMARRAAAGVVDLRGVRHSQHLLNFINNGLRQEWLFQKVRELSARLRNSLNSRAVR
jgi:hypothetical protein